eukprot:3795755-Amphidinium_carterae.3
MGLALCGKAMASQWTEVNYLGKERGSMLVWKPDSPRLREVHEVTTASIKGKEVSGRKRTRKANRGQVAILLK